MSPQVQGQFLVKIRSIHPNNDPSFDLEDCDNVLRIEDEAGVDGSIIEEIIQNHGFYLDTLL